MSKINPLVSIIIPTFNSADYLPETVESALSQSYKFIEVIIVDDGSSDETITFFENFKKKGVQCFSIKNQGASNARNVGLSKSKGDYIQFLDADDILHKNKIELQIKYMLNENSDISFTIWGRFSKDITKHSDFKFKHIDYSKTRSGKELMISFGMENWFMPVFCWLTRKDLIDKAGSWNVELTNNDDGEYFTRVLYNAKKVVCANEILAYYRVVTSSLSKLNSIEKVDSALKSYNLVLELLLKDSRTELLAYPKRMFYHLFVWVRDDYPYLSRTAASEFDKLKVNCFLIRKRKYWKIINLFGLYYGTIIYNFLLKIVVKIKGS